MGKVVDVPEGKIGLDDEFHSRRRREQVVADHNLVAVRCEQYALAEDDLSDFIGDGGYRVGAEIHHVLVSAGLVDIAVTVDTEIELLA